MSAVCRMGDIHAKIWDDDVEFCATNFQFSAESNRIEMSE